LEKELQETQRRAGVMPQHSTFSSTYFPTTLPSPLSLSLSPLLPPPISFDLSDEEGELSAKEEFDTAIQPTSLLDVSAGKAKADLASRGGLAGRQAPTAVIQVKPPKRSSNDSPNHNIITVRSLCPSHIKFLAVGNIHSCHLSRSLL